jgi:hypothetical protein
MAPIRVITIKNGDKDMGVLRGVYINRSRKMKSDNAALKPAIMAVSLGFGRYTYVPDNLRAGEWNLRQGVVLTLTVALLLLTRPAAAQEGTIYYDPERPAPLVPCHPFALVDSRNGDILPPASTNLYSIPAILDTGSTRIVMDPGSASFLRISSASSFPNFNILGWGLAAVDDDGTIPPPPSSPRSSRC